MAERSGKTGKVTIGLWFDVDAGDIHLSIPGHGLSTINGTASSKRGNPRLFYEKGKLLSVEIRAIHRSIANDNKVDFIDFAKLTGEKKDPSPKKLCDVVHSGALLLQSS